MAKISPKLSILLPVRNEGINIEMMIKILTAVLDISHEILVIYDFAQDDTIPVIKRIQPKFRNVRLIQNKFEKGVPNAIKTGVSGAKGKYILIFAVDDVGPALAIEDMVKLLDQGCDFISCTRYAHGGRRLGGSIVEGALSRIANRLFNYLSGSAFTDSTTGFKMFKKSFFENIEIESNPRGWAVVFELAVKAQEKRLKLGEVPIISIDRLYGGKSTFNLGPWLREYLRWFIWGVLHLKRRQKVKIRIPISTAF